jgi:outer membrane biosynthesis protein TonB
MSLPERHKKKQKPVALVLSILFHIMLAGGLFYLAAREGVLGKQMRTLVAVSVPEEKKKVEQKPKDEPKVERPKEEAKVESRPSAAPPGNAANPPPPAAVSAAAPPAAIGADFDFNDGNTTQATANDPVLLYKGSVERAFRSRWTKPEEMDDSQFFAEADVAVRPDGTVAEATWRHGSGNEKWDASVRQALQSVKEIGRKPPKGFPGKFVVRFDAVAAEPVN